MCRCLWLWKEKKSDCQWIYDGCSSYLQRFNEWRNELLKKKQQYSLLFFFSEKKKKKGEKKRHSKAVGLRHYPAEMWVFKYVH